MKKVNFQENYLNQKYMENQINIKDVMNLKVLNDYSCVLSRDPDVEYLYHFTNSADAVINIATGCFWATDIRDFRRNGEDRNEGYLILDQILENLYEIDASIADIVKQYIGTEEAMNKFFDTHETYLVSTSLGSNMQYLWKNYAKEEGYQIVFDKKEMISSLYIVLKDGRVRADDALFKHAQLLYDYEKQIDIIKKKCQELIETQDKYLSIQSNVDCILKHLMYIGNFYKRNETYYLQEDEYRILVNLAPHGNEHIDNLLPERIYNPHNNKHYIEIKFSPKAIKKIVCATEYAKNLIADKIPDIEVEVRR